MNSPNPKAEFFFSKAGKWQNAYQQLRNLVLDCGLTEEVKWGVPCYTWQNRNIVLIHGFKEYCALLFHKGALLKDTEGILIQQTENVQSARQIRFSGIDQILTLEGTLKAYIFEAIEVEKSGLKVTFKEPAEYEMPEEFKESLNRSPHLKAAFEGLTPGRQKAYLLHFSKAKQSKTRQARIEKYTPHILAGKGIDD